MWRRCDVIYVKMVKKQKIMAVFVFGHSRNIRFLQGLWQKYVGCTNHAVYSFVNDYPTQGEGGE